MSGKSTRIFDYLGKPTQFVREQQTGGIVTTTTSPLSAINLATGGTGSGIATGETLTITNIIVEVSTVTENLTANNATITNQLEVGTLLLTGNSLSSTSTDISINAGLNDIYLKGAETYIQTDELYLKDRIVDFAYGVTDTQDRKSRGIRFTWYDPEDLILGVRRLGFMGYKIDSDGNGGRFVFYRKSSETAGVITNSEPLVVNEFELDKIYTNVITSPDYASQYGQQLTINSGSHMTINSDGNQTTTVDGICSNTVGEYNLTVTDANSTSGTLTITTENEISISSNATVDITAIDGVDFNSSVYVKNGAVTKVSIDHVDGNVSIAGTLDVGTLGDRLHLISNSANFFSGKLTVNNDGDVTISDSLTINTTGLVFDSADGILKVANGIRIGTVAGSYFSANNEGIVTLSNTENATSDTSGALRVAGGIGCSQDVFVDGDIYGTTFTATSDIRKKHSIINLELGVDFIEKIKPVSFIFNDDEKEVRHVGFIAQQVKEVLDNISSNGQNIFRNNGICTNYNNGTLMGINYNAMIPPLYKAIQEINVRLSKLENKLS